MTSFVPPRASAAIRIVAPSVASPSSPVPSAPLTPPREQPPKLSPKKSTPKCRNILIHGYCKNEGKGCIYDHSDGPSQPSSAPTPSTTAVSSPVTSVNVNAPVFVPKTPHIASPIVVQATPATNLNSLPIDEDNQPPAHPQQAYFDLATDYDVASAMNNIELDPSRSSTYLANEAQTRLYAQAGYLDTQEYYHTPPTFVRQPLNYHLYTQLPYLPYGSTSQSKPLSHRFFMSDTLREDLQRRSEAIYSLMPRYPSNNEKSLPEELHVYHSLVPLEPSGSGSGTSSPGGTVYLAPAAGFYPHPSGSGGGDGKDGRDSREQLRRKWFAGFSSMVYKATNREDGSLVVLRRIEGFRLMQESAFGGVETWRKIKHPNIVSLREAFTTRAFGDHSLVFAYDYHPTAQTLYNLHFASDAQPSGASRPPRNTRYGKGGHAQRDSGSNGSVQNHVEESIMWSYVIQIANALKEVHDQGLALRSLDVTKVLVTGKNRVRINCCGIFDVLSYDPRHVNIEALQQDDLINFGRLIFALCCHNVSAVTNLTKALEVLSRHYSPDMKNVALFLISKPGPGKVIDQLLEMFGTRLLTEMNALQNYTDQLEGELMSELENGRLVRLMSKMGFINERPDFNHELRWSETGDRYIISLFRDYVFHQVDETQKPVVNITHVIACLNKLDTGSDERIMLVSRDEQTCLVVSYKEIKACIDSAFSELARPRLPGILR